MELSLFLCIHIARKSTRAKCKRFPGGRLPFLFFFFFFASKERLIFQSIYSAALRSLDLHDLQYSLEPSLEIRETKKKKTGKKKIQNLDNSPSSSRSCAWSWFVPTDTDVSYGA